MKFEVDIVQIKETSNYVTLVAFFIQKLLKAELFHTFFNNFVVFNVSTNAICFQQNFNPDDGLRLLKSCIDNSYNWFQLVRLIYCTSVKI